VRLGPLERRVLERLWQLASAARVRDLQPSFPDIAYTTLMTTLDRLHRKGLLDRVPDGRAFSYRPRLTRAEAVLSSFADELGPLDADTLDALEQLVRERKRALGGEPQ
jgi:predicted transcriptional regulator